MLRPLLPLAVALATTAAAVSGCATEHPYVWVSEVQTQPDSGQTILPRDTILVVVQNQPAMSGEFVVGDHGDYPQPTLGTIEVAGKTTTQVQGELQTRLNGIVVNPQVVVSIVKVAPIRVNVVGEVKTPGSYELPRGRGVIPALAAAGWLTEFADRDKIFVIRSDANGPQRIRFRASELTAAEEHAIGFRLHDGDVVVVE
jgi:polysaccharide biosynthesis/export protein